MASSPRCCYVFFSALGGASPWSWRRSKETGASLRRGPPARRSGPWRWAPQLLESDETTSVFGRISRGGHAHHRPFRGRQGSC